MVKVTFSPIKEVIVHEHILMNLDDLVRSRVTPAGSFPLYWCDGILFTFNSMPWTKDIVRDYLEGKVHWVEVQYTRMDKYRPILELNDQSYGSQVKVRAIDTTASAVHTDFVKWLKTKM